MKSARTNTTFTLSIYFVTLQNLKLCKTEIEKMNAKNFQKAILFPLRRKSFLQLKKGLKTQSESLRSFLQRTNLLIKAKNLLLQVKNLLATREKKLGILVFFLKQLICTFYRTFPIFRA